MDEYKPLYRPLGAGPSELMGASEVSNKQAPLAIRRVVDSGIWQFLMIGFAEYG